jgi:hypothetical protein
MAGYFGTETQQRLQAQAEASAAMITATPGACQAGRTMGCDDPDRLGWETISRILDRDGVCGFRLISTTQAKALAGRLKARDCRFDTWDVFLAARAPALAAAQAILSRGLPDDLADLPRPGEPEGAYTRGIQHLMGAAGVVPFSGSLLTGALGPAVTVAVGAGSSEIVAAAHGYLPHNAYSAHHHHAWGGLVAVAPSQRGRGLGTYINARLIAGVFGELAATHVYELVSEANIPSRRMVEACGLRRAPDLVCGVATSSGGARLTR